jgi:o-succinylbenzoate synthase
MVREMRIERAELITVELPLVSAFRASWGATAKERKLLVRLMTDIGDGWGECGATEAPLYTSEHLAGARQVMVDHLLPRLAAEPFDPLDVLARLRPVQGNQMAKAALEMAVLDVWGRAQGQSFAELLGAERTTVPAGVAVGITGSVPELLDTVAGYLDEGYRRVKLKIMPGWDLEPVRAVRERFGPVLLQVDANMAYTSGDPSPLLALDRFELLLIEQPFAADDLLAHAALARRMRTPVCLDESIGSPAAAALALELGACSVINIKPGRVGGYQEAVRIHDLALSRGVAVWCGGMLETGLGRAGNLALAALPGFTLPGDLSASRRYYQPDLTAPFELHDGHLGVPSKPGLGVEVDPAVLAAVEQGRVHWHPPGATV